MQYYINKQGSISCRSFKGEAAFSDFVFVEKLHGLLWNWVGNWAWFLGYNWFLMWIWGRERELCLWMTIILLLEVMDIAFFFFFSFSNSPTILSLKLAKGVFYILKISIWLRNQLRTVKLTYKIIGNIIFRAICEENLKWVPCILWYDNSAVLNYKRINSKKLSCQYYPDIVVWQLYQYFLLAPRELVL